MSLNFIEPKGKCASLNRNASPFTIRKGSCFLFINHIQKFTQNLSQSNPEEEVKLRKEDRTEKRARFVAFVLNCDANNVRKHGQQS